MEPGEEGPPAWLARLFGSRAAPPGPRLVAFPRCGGAHARVTCTGSAAPRANYAGNHTSTTKYTLLTFLPKSLFEQYR